MKCKKHPLYKAVRPGKTKLNCETCELIWEIAELNRRCDKLEAALHLAEEAAADARGTANAAMYVANYG